jgi:SagB-type dehydrogenase family enzyme
VRFRRAKALVTYWRDNELVFENYLAQQVVSADPLTTQILHVLTEWRRPDELSRTLSQYRPRSVRKALWQLNKHNLVVEEGTALARRDEALAKQWSAWLPHAACFHFSTKDIRYLSGRRAEQQVREYLAESPQPAFFKSYPDAKGQPLPPRRPPDGEFVTVLTARRTQRDFSHHPVPLNSISDLLYYTWGATGFITVPLLGRLPHKTSPSGGARNPIEVYPLVLNVAGLPPGLYHYDAQQHGLERLNRGGFQKQAVAYCSGQQYVKHAAALFLMTAISRRSAWKYRNARAYRVMLLDAGHLCQTFCLTATWLGLAPFCTAALNDSLIEKDLGLDGIEESVIYAAGVGMPRVARAGELSKRRRFLASL